MIAQLIAVSLALSVVAPSPEGLLETPRRILFLGDSITYDGRYVADFETWLTARYPDRHYEVINAGLPSETVSGLSEEGHAGGQFPRPVLRERLDRVLTAAKPELVVACYGMNCGIYQPFAADRFARYQAGILALRDAAIKAGAGIIFITPPAYDHARGKNAAPEYNDAVLGAYGRWLIEKRDEGWTVIDLHGPMMAEIARRRAEKPDFTFQPDGVHPDDAGHWFIAQQLIGFFGDASSAAVSRPEAMLETLKASPVLLSRIRERMVLLRDAWLTHTGHQRPGLSKGLPLDEAQKKAEEMGKGL